MKRLKYMEIKFHDNDFSGHFTTALNRLWKYVDGNNGHMKSTSDIFKEMFDNDVLIPMIQKMLCIAIVESNIEFMTRGLYWDKEPFNSSINWNEHIVKDPLKLHYEETYVILDKEDIEFHEDDSFTKKWQNGEHISLNLKNGYVETF
jgi:hypothetical protein